MNMIKLESVSFGFEAPILNQLSLQLMEGDYALLTGENGSGKSTLLRLIIGELKPQQGSVRLMGEEPARALRHRRIGYVPQNSISKNQHFPATVEEVMMTGLYRELGFFCVPGSVHRRRVMEALADFGMEQSAKKRIGELSGGQQQRVMLARALVGRPELLILDEPSTGVDAESFQQLCARLEQIHRDGVSILLVTHGSLDKYGGVNHIYRMEEGGVLRL